MECEGAGEERAASVAGTGFDDGVDEHARFVVASSSIAIDARSSRVDVAGSISSAAASSAFASFVSPFERRSRAAAR